MEGRVFESSGSGSVWDVQGMELGDVPDLFLRSSKTSGFRALVRIGGGELSQELWGSRLECLAADGAGLGEDPYRQLAALYGWRVGSTDRDRSGSDCRVEDPSVSVVCLHKFYIL